MHGCDTRTSRSGLSIDLRSSRRVASRRREPHLHAALVARDRHEKVMMAADVLLKTRVVQRHARTQAADDGRGRGVEFGEGETILRSQSACSPVIMEKG